MESFDNTIKSYKLLGLHGDKDIELTFDDPYKILIAENGTGKTTVLNSLFYLLSGEYQRLAGIEFEKIELLFTNGVKISLNKSDIYIQFPEALKEQLHFKRLQSYIGESLARELLAEIINQESHSDVRSSRAFFLARREFNGPASELIHLTRRLKDGLKSDDYFSQTLTETRELIKDNLNLEILYLPTYRRVEEDLQRLGYDGEFTDNKEQLIHFGMRDVSRRFKDITESIRESAVTWYSRISGRMLDELMAGTLKNRETLEKISDPAALGIVLDRIGDNISKERKIEIIELVKSGEIQEDRYEVMTYFLSNLVEIYEQQREKDNKIKAFVSNASKYLVGKEIIYDESEVTITIVNTRTKKEVSLEKLSSGEKQLISILSKLYLEANGPTFIIFDEPELSLSIDWQRQLLPDLIASGQCKLLLAATHSPFIFENDLDKYAEALDVRYRETSD